MARDPDSDHISGAPLLGLPAVRPRRQVLKIPLRKRIFHLLKLPETGPKHISTAEATFFAVVVSVAVIISMLNINIKYIITLNGAFFGLIFCYFIPALLHLKCAYLHQRPPPPPEMVEEYSKSPQ